jgi:hypothetical protein
LLKDCHLVMAIAERGHFMRPQCRRRLGQRVEAGRASNSNDVLYSSRYLLTIKGRVKPLPGGKNLEIVV